MQKHLKRSELAELLGVHPQTIRNWEKNAGLPRRKLGRSVRYPLDEVQRWLKSA